MKLFAIADLHLSTARPKAMDVFGPQWSDHFARISADWRSRVTDDDAVLIPGDISWATRLAEARPDLDALAALPGKKILLRGNHDYWWTAPSKVRKMLPLGIHIIQNDALRLGEYVVCGTRGWAFPMGGALGAEDEKIFEREKIRLRLSLDAASRLGDGPRIVLMHYPPLYENWPDTDFTRILESYRVSRVLFGHLHGDVLQQVHLRHYEHGGICYDLVSADYLNFRLFALEKGWEQESHRSCNTQSGV